MLCKNIGCEPWMQPLDSNHVIGLWAQYATIAPPLRYIKHNYKPCLLNKSNDSHSIKYKTKPTFIVHNLLSTLLTYTYSSLSNGERIHASRIDSTNPKKCQTERNLQSIQRKFHRASEFNIFLYKYVQKTTHSKANLITPSIPDTATFTNNSCYSVLLHINGNT